MKTQLLLVGIAMFAVIFASSCQKDDMAYSCDKEINMWVKSNLTEIKVMNSADWQKISDTDTQRGVYRAFTAEQKKSLWIDKLAKSLDLDWTEQEKKHIYTLLQIIDIHSKLFEGNSAITDQAQIDFYRWLDYAREELKWDDYTIYSVCYTPQVLDKNKKVDINFISSGFSVKTRSETGGEKTCNCGDAHGILACYHPYGSYNCRAIGCAKSDFGCGMLWLERCWGVCFTNA